MTDEEEVELYLRWWQLNTFMPVVHFWKPPNAFNLSMVICCSYECITITCFNMLVHFSQMASWTASQHVLRRDVVLPRLLRLAEAAAGGDNREEHGWDGIIQPLWTFNPDDPELAAIDDTVLLSPQEFEFNIQITLTFV